MLLLLTGGAANGKSRFAERLAAAYDGPRTYLATMRPDGEDGVERVRRHRRQREGLGFETIEKEAGLTEVTLQKRGLVLLECIATLLDNEWFQLKRTKEDAIGKVMDAVGHLLPQADMLVVVTNTISAEGKTYDEATMAYIDAISEINGRLIEMADAVIEMRVGRAILLKGKSILDRVFPSAVIETATIVDPVEVVAKADGPVLALAPDDATLTRLARAADFSEDDIAHGALLDRPVLSGLDSLLIAEGHQVFGADFSRYRLILSRLWGDGVIPVEEKDRRLREMAGRLTIHMAFAVSVVMYYHDSVWLLIHAS